MEIFYFFGIFSLLYFLFLIKLCGDNPFIPKEFRHELVNLVNIKKIVDLGKNEGIKAYLGEKTEKGYRHIVLSETGSKGGKKSRKNKKSPYHELMEELKAKNFRALLKIFEQDVMDQKDLFSVGRIIKLNKKNKINIKIDEIDYKKKLVYYRVPRGNSVETFPPVSFKTLQNLIPKYRIK